MTIVAQAYDYVIGADTHARTHAVCIAAAGTAEILGARTFRPLPQGWTAAVAGSERGSSDLGWGWRLAEDLE